MASVTALQKASREETIVTAFGRLLKGLRLSGSPSMLSAFEHLRRPPKDCSLKHLQRP
jgi:hypothetical protein